MAVLSTDTVSELLHCMGPDLAFLPTTTMHQLIEFASAY